MGKTWLAVRLAYEFGSQYPDAHLYYNLGGSAPSPADPTEVLRHFLVQLGVDESLIPADEAERAAVFRSETVDKRILLVLDDAVSVVQVKKLLPSSSRSAVLVTSRKRLDGLSGRQWFHRVALPPFSQETALQLLTQSVGPELMTAEPVAVERLLALCGGVPLALSVAAARLEGRGGSLSTVVEKILSGRPLELLVEDGEQSTEAVLDMSYRELTSEQARAYRLLGLRSGPDFGVPAAAALLGVPEVEALLDALVEANLLEAIGADRYRFHVMVALHAGDRANDDSTVEERRAARQLSVLWYARRTAALAKVLSPRWWATTLFEDVTPATSDRTRAVEELETERVNLMEALREADDRMSPAFCEALQPWLYNSGRADDLITTNKVGLGAAQRTGDRAAAMRMHNQLGTGYELAGRHDLAMERFVLSLEIAKSIGHALGEQSALEWIGLVHGGLGELEPAVRYLELSLEAAERVPDPPQRERAITLSRMHIERLLTDAGKTYSTDELGRALGYFHDNGEDVNEARILVLLGRAYLESGESRLAQPVLERAVTLFESQRALLLQIKALRVLADVEDQLGEHESAHSHRVRADGLTTPEQ